MMAGRKDKDIAKCYKIQSGSQLLKDVDTNAYF